MITLEKELLPRKEERKPDNPYRLYLLLALFAALIIAMMIYSFYTSYHISSR